MKKLAKLGLGVLLGLSAVATTASAVEDGSYKCVIIKISKGHIEKKLTEKEYETVALSLKDNVITDGNNEKYTYKLTYTKKNGNKYDIYEDKKFLIAVPAQDKNGKLFDFGYMDKKDKVNYYGYCINKKYLKKHK